MTVITLETGVRARPRSRASNALQWAVALAMLAIAVSLAVARLELHITASTVLTGSMRPTFAPGDAIITEPIPVTQIRPGMVVLATPRGQRTPFAHRVLAVKHRGGSVIVQTRGDANPQPDRWQDVLTPSATVPRVVGSVPRLGYLIEVLHGRTTQRHVTPVALAGLLVTVLACALILCTGSTRPTPVFE